MIECDIIRSWLLEQTMATTDGRYVHRLLKEDPNCRGEALASLEGIILKAHDDARCYLRRLARISLDPLGYTPGTDPARGYPEQLDLQTLKGYFGEIIAGIVGEAYEHFGEWDWEVPAFLFRFHQLAFDALEKWQQTQDAPGRIPGRHGDDCLLFRRDREGHIVQSLVCEAKCTADHDTTLISDAHRKTSEPNLKPVGVRCLIEILEDRTDGEAEQWILALRELWLKKPGPRYERNDLVCYTCGRPPRRNSTWLPTDKPHTDYSANRRIEAVEVHLSQVDEIVSAVYRKQESQI